MSGKKLLFPCFLGLAICQPSLVPAGQVQVLVDHVESMEASAEFRFSKVLSPRRNDIGAKAVFSLVDGRADRNGAGLNVLNDGQLPVWEDEPSANFFFSAGTRGGRISADLGEVVDVAAVDTYSWHPGSRGPQVYRLYAANGAGPGFQAAPSRGTDPTKVGWSLLAAVDTSASVPGRGGQYGVCITNVDGSLGQYRYLLWDVSPTRENDPFGNTFFSEIDIVGQNPAPEPETKADLAQIEKLRKKIQVGSDCEVLLDMTAAPDLAEWADAQLTPMIQKWYPRIVEMLPSEGFSAPKRINIAIRPMDGVAFTSGSRVVCSAEWLRRELKREAVGAVFHELVHVVQQYRSSRGANAGWIVEGIPDYLRWYIYEPQTRGAEIGPRSVERASYDASYRVSANFLNWVVNNHYKEIVRKLNTALRNGVYKEDLWIEWTGKPVEELGKLWKDSLKPATSSSQAR